MTEKEEEDDDEVGSVLFVKNLNFSTTDEALQQVCCCQLIMTVVENRYAAVS